jgi:hypothetical protein
MPKYIQLKGEYLFDIAAILDSNTSNMSQCNFAFTWHEHPIGSFLIAFDLSFESLILDAADDRMNLESKINS